MTVALRVRLPHLRTGEVEGELGAEDGGEADGPSVQMSIFGGRR